MQGTNKLNAIVDAFVHDLNANQKVEFVRRCITRGIAFQEIFSQLEQQRTNNEQHPKTETDEKWSLYTGMGKQLKPYRNAHPGALGLSASMENTTGEIQWPHGYRSTNSKIEGSSPDMWAHFLGKQLETWGGNPCERVETCVIQKGENNQYVILGSKTGGQEYYLCDSQMVHSVFGPRITGRIEDGGGEIQWSHGYKTIPSRMAHAEIANWFGIKGQKMESYRDGHPGHVLETVMFEQHENFVTTVGSKSGRQEYVMIGGQLLHRQFGELISAKMNASSGKVIWSYGCFSCKLRQSNGSQTMPSSSKRIPVHPGLGALQMSHIFTYCLGDSIKSHKQFAGVTRLSLVCSRWRTFAWQIHWREVDLSQKNIASVITDTRLKDLCVQSRCIQILSLYSCSKITDDGLLGFFFRNDERCFPAMQSLDLAGCKQLCNMTIGKAAVACPKLQSLRLAYFEHLSDEAVQAITFTLRRLTHIDFSFCRSLSDAAVRSVATNCPKLLSLDISHCDKVTNDALVAIGSRSKMLGILRFSDCSKITDASPLRSCRRLTRLNCSHCLGLDMSTLAGCISLECLTASGCSQLRRLSGFVEGLVGLKTLDLSGCRQLSDMSALANCTLLHTLMLCGCPELADVECLGSCPELETLCIIGAEQLTSISSLDKCAKLLTLTLNACNRVSDISSLQHCALVTLELNACEDLVDVSALGSCRTLHTLSIRSCSRLTSEALQPLSNCLTLHTLRLHRCYRVTKVDMCLTLRNLELLDLSYCHAVTDISGLRGCRALQTLGLIQCKNLVDVSPLAACAALYTLDMSECSSVSDVSALSGCAHLRTLRLSACAVVGGRGLLRCPTLERLDLSECRLLRNLRGIQNCTSLASVTISECPVLNDISALSGCAALSQLHVTFCPMVVNLTSLSDCENLSFMKVTNCSSLRGSDLRQWTSLRKIHLMSCDSLENLDWLSECPALVEVYLFDNPVLSCVRGVGRCRALESLSIQHSLRLEDLSALSACPRLENLECVSIGVKDGSKLPCSPRLKEVTLRECIYLADLGALSRCPALRILTVKACPSLMDLGAIRGMPFLHSLDLSSCRLLRDIAPLSNAANLDSLDLSNCDNLLQLHPILACRRLTNLTLTAGQNYASLSIVAPHVPHIHWAEAEFDNTSSDSGSNDLSELP